jgi:hypothetical protein
MSVNPRAIAMFGIGFGAIAMASFGRLLPAFEVVAPVAAPQGYGFTSFQNLNMSTPAHGVPVGRLRALRESEDFLAIF